MMFAVFQVSDFDRGWTNPGWAIFGRAPEYLDLVTRTQRQELASQRSRAGLIDHAETTFNKSLDHGSDSDFPQSVDIACAFHPGLVVEMSCTSNVLDLGKGEAERVQEGRCRVCLLQW